MAVTFSLRDGHRIDAATESLRDAIFNAVDGIEFEEAEQTARNAMIAACSKYPGSAYAIVGELYTEAARYFDV